MSGTRRRYGRHRPRWTSLASVNACLYASDFKGSRSSTFCLLFPAPTAAKTDRKSATGATVSRSATSSARQSRFQFRRLERADAIAEILSAYDDLIENNRRRIALLEEAARMLYREWFVRLRFPGHEHVKIIDGVPEGWERRAGIGGVRVV